MSECPNPKHLLSNSDLQEIWDLGFQDIAQCSQVNVYFSGSTEKCKTYHEVHKSLLKQGKNILKDSYENPVPLDEVCPIFQWAGRTILIGEGKWRMENLISRKDEI
jgi:hypothetical protein